MATNKSQQRQAFGQQLGLMYKRWVLDSIPNLGHAVSLDFSRRPELYKQVDPKTAKLLTDLQGQYGYAADFPNQEIRLALMKPLFGVSDGHTNTNDASAFQKAGFVEVFRRSETRPIIRCIISRG